MSLLREETGRGATAPEGIVQIARVEPDLTIAEVEVRHLGELHVGIRSTLIARAVHPEIVRVDESFGMREEDDSDLIRTETELIDHEDFTSTTDGTATVTHAELRGNHEDIVTLLPPAKRLHHPHRADVLTELIGTEFAFAVVVELPRCSDQGDDLFDRFVVRRRDLLPARNGAR